MRHRWAKLPKDVEEGSEDSGTALQTPSQQERDYLQVQVRLEECPQGGREPQGSVCDGSPGQTAGELVSQQSVKETVGGCLMKCSGACNFMNVFDQETIASLYFYNFNFLFKIILAGLG